MHIFEIILTIFNYSLVIGFFGLLLVFALKDWDKYYSDQRRKLCDKD